MLHSLLLTLPLPLLLLSPLAPPLPLDPSQTLVVKVVEEFNLVYLDLHHRHHLHLVEAMIMEEITLLHLYLLTTSAPLLAPPLPLLLLSPLALPPIPLAPPLPLALVVEDPLPLAPPLVVSLVLKLPLKFQFFKIVVQVAERINL